MDYSLENLERFTRKIKVFIDLTENLKKLSTDLTIQTACVVFNYDCTRIAAIGYNGVPAGLPHRDRSHIPHGTDDGSGMVHAEMNALTKMTTQGCEPCIMYTTYSPCSRCAGSIINSKCITHVLYSETYKPSIGINMLVNAGVYAIKIEDGDPEFDESLMEELYLDTIANKTR